MQKTTLILHHLEPCWNDSYKKFGIEFEELELNAAKWIRNNKPSRVILTRFEDYRLNNDYNYLHGLVDHVYNYAYGWESDMFQNESDYCQGGSHSEVVHLPQWIKELKSDRVNLGGAFRGECLEDMEIALKFVGAKMKFVNSLCVG